LPLKSTVNRSFTLGVVFEAQGRRNGEVSGSSFPGTEFHFRRMVVSLPKRVVWLPEAVFWLPETVFRLTRLAVRYGKLGFGKRPMVVATGGSDVSLEQAVAAVK
jgi:hypothetical protein